MFGRGHGGSASYRNWSIVGTIVAINVIIFILDAFSPEPGEGQGQLRWLASFLSMETEKLWKFWGLLTHGFAHSSITSDIGFWHIAGNMISRIESGGTVDGPGMEILDGSGMYALPGFVDAHAHVGTIGQGLTGPLTPPEYIFKLWLAHGVTTVREVGAGMGLEWTLESPAPYHSFSTPPDVGRRRTD